MAGLNLQIVALSVPFGTEFPGTVQELLDLIAEYLTISGDENFSGINYGSVEPDADNRDRPWFRLDDEDNPLGWYAWTGAAWTPIPVIIPNGTTAQRPTSPTIGQEYYDTDIDVAIVYNGSAWVTLAGSPGDLKYVKAATIAEALTKNPGWSQDPDSEGYVIAGASDGSSAYEYGTTAGADEVTLVVANLPSDGVKLPSGVGNFPGAFQNGSQAPGVVPITTGLGDAATISTGPLNGGVTQEPISVLQKTIYRWCLVKD